MIKKAFRFVLSKLYWGLLIHILNDTWFAKIRYWLVMDVWGNFEDPVLFTEKIQHIKLYQRTELRRMAADRIKVRYYVRDAVGEEHLIPLYGIYPTLSREAWEQLPGQFVLKANHGCGMVSIIRQKSTVHYQTIKELTETWKATDYYDVGREWAYKNLSREILAEKLLTDAKGNIPSDWKFFCFHGRVHIIQEDRDRYGDSDQTRNLYDRDYNELNAQLLYPPSKEKSHKPRLMDSAIEIAEELSRPFNFIRVDLYITEQDIYFGELTNYPGNGFIPFQPRPMEYKIGKLLSLDAN